MTCGVSFSLCSVSMLFGWGGHFCHICVKCFLLFTTVQKLYKSIKNFQSYDHKMYCHLFMVHSVYVCYDVKLITAGLEDTIRGGWQRSPPGSRTRRTSIDVRRSNGHSLKPRALELRAYERYYRSSNYYRFWQPRSCFRCRLMSDTVVRYWFKLSDLQNVRFASGIEILCNRNRANIRFRQPPSWILGILRWCRSGTRWPAFKRT